MRILFLSDNFPPEVNAPASRTLEHCREWVRAGHQVTVITCAPNFPAGKVFPRYSNRLFAREVVEGIDVIRVWSYITANAGVLLRSLDYASYAVAAVLAAPFAGRADVVVATSPQFFTAGAGWLTAALRRRPFVFELRDLWPESIRAVGAAKSERLLGALEAVELFLYRRARAIISVTRAFRTDLARRGIDPAKVYVVTNGADLARFKPRPRDDALAAQLGLTGKFVAGYVGTHGMAHGLDTLLDAAARLQAQGADNIAFLLLGDGAEKRRLKDRAAAMGLANVVFVESVPKEEVVRYWSLLDVSIIHLKKAPLFETVIPSKLFEGMAMAIPVLHGVEGESAEIVRGQRVGETFEPENAAALAQAILDLAADPARRRAMSQRAVLAAQGYDRKALAAEMLAVLERVVSGEAPGASPAADRQPAIPLPHTKVGVAPEARQGRRRAARR